MSVRPSVRLSASCRCSVETAKRPQIFTVGSHTILVFPHQTVWQYSDGDPLTGASNAEGYEKIAIFDQYLALSRK